jgi:rhodanese-related sulfurtransferase
MGAAGDLIMTTNHLDLAPEQLDTLGPGARLIDVREPDEFTGPLGHLPGSELVPLGTLEAAARGWSRETPLVLICRSGVRSGRAAGYLATQGFSRLFNLAGGMIAVNALGLRVEGASGERPSPA